MEGNLIRQTSNVCHLSFLGCKVTWTRNNNGLPGGVFTRTINSFFKKIFNVLQTFAIRNFKFKYLLYL